MSRTPIRDNVRRILDSLPDGVDLIGAAKTRTSGEIQEAIEGGLKIVGHNYVQEALSTKPSVCSKAAWHFIGHLQRNKVKYALKLFDMIQALDSIRLAKEIDKCCEKNGTVMDCLVEINSGREKNKYGVLPEETEDFVFKVSESFPRVKIKGLMTMGPFTGEEEDFRPYFKKTRELFESLRKKENSLFWMKHLSMGMSSSYEVAIREGANMVRIGTAIFGPRETLR